MFVNLALYFFIYAFIGYLSEVVACSVVQKKMVNRGFLFGPIVPVYGFGALLILGATYPLTHAADFLASTSAFTDAGASVTFTSALADAGTSVASVPLASFLEPLSSNPPLLILAVFVVSAVVCSILEYLTSFLLEKLFHLRYWDYSHKFANLHGRICLQNALIFGLGGVIAALWAHPLVAQFVAWLNPTFRTVTAIVLLTFITLDTLSSSCAAKRAARIFDFTKVVGDQTNEIKHQTRRMFVQFFQLWRGADPAKLVEKAHADFEARQQRFRARIAARQKKLEAKISKHRH